MKFTAAVVVATLTALAFVHLSAPTPSPKTSIPYCVNPNLVQEGEIYDTPAFAPCQHLIIYREA